MGEKLLFIGLTLILLIVYRSTRKPSYNAASAYFLVYGFFFQAENFCLLILLLHRWNKKSFRVSGVITSYLKITNFCKIAVLVSNMCFHPII